MLGLPDWDLASWSWFEYGCWSLVDPHSEFWLFILIFEGAKTIYAPKVLILGFQGCWRILTGVLHLDTDLNMVTGLWFTHVPNFDSILNMKMQRTSMSFKSSFGALEDAGGSWLGFGTLFLIWIWSLVFDISIFQILALYLDFEGAKSIKVIQVLIFGFGGHWRFMTGVWNPDIELDLVTGLWYTHIPNFGSLSWFWRCKEHPCPLGPDLGLWRTLEVPDWGLASWSWFGYGHWSLIYPWSKFWLSISILKVQRTSMSFKSSFWTLEDDGGSWLYFGSLILILIWSLVHDTTMIQMLALYLDFEGPQNIHVL